MYRDLLLCKWLTPTDKIIYTMIADKYDFYKKFGRLQDGKMGLSIRQLAEQTGIDRRAIRKSIDRLTKLEFISEYKQSGEKSYYIAKIQTNEVSDHIKWLANMPEVKKRAI